MKIIFLIQSGENLLKLRPQQFLYFFKTHIAFLVGFFAMMAMSLNGWGQIQISEGFESGLPTSYGSTTSFSLSSGTWTGQANGVIRGTVGIHSGSYTCQLRSQTGAQITSPNIATGGVSTVTFWASVSTGSGSSVQVNYSTDGGSTWTPATGSPFSLSTTVTQKTATVNSNSNNILVQFYRTNSTVYLDDITINAIPCTSPSAPTAATHAPSQTQIAWNWNTVSGSTGYKYSTTNNYSGAIDNGTNTTFTQTGLNCGTAYMLYVWAYNACGNSASSTALTQTTAACSGSPTLTVSPTSLTGFNYIVGSGPSTEQTLTVSGSNLTNNISIVASSNYEISKTSGTGYTTPLALTPSGGSVSSTTIYVRLKAGLTAGNYNSEIITASSTGASSQTVICSGSVSAVAGPVYLIDEEFNATTSVATLPSGWSSSGTWISSSNTVYNRRANCLKLTANGTLTTPTFANGDLLSFWLKNVSGNQSGNLEIQILNGYWSTIATITNISNIPQTYFYTIATGVTQIRFNFTDGGDDVYLDDVMVRAAGKCGVPALIARILVNSCGNTQEGTNELVAVKTGNTSIDITKMFITFPSVASGGYSFGSGCTMTFTTNPTYTAAINSLAGATVAIEPPGGIVPANSNLVIFTGALPDFTYDFSNSSGTIYYVVYCNNSDVSGRFSNKPSSGTTRSFAIFDKSTGCYDQVLYNSSIPDVDGEQAIYDLTTRSLTYDNNGCTKVLPIELIGFNAVCSKNDVQIKWTTSSETNNDYFTLEKSTDLNTWEYVSTIKGAGNSNEIISYSYTDNSVLHQKLYYRLRQTDFDGASETFDPVGVLCNDSQSDYFTLYPNPAMNQVMCSIYATEESSAIIEITNYLGQLVYSQPYGLINGSNNFNLDVSQYQSGVYNIIIHLEEGSIIKTKNLVVQK
jgi:hypothetical protein